MIQLAITASDGVVVDVYQTGDSGGPAVIVCHGFVQNRLAFESNKRSLLVHLASLGCTVYVMELRGRSGKHTAHGLHEYVDVDAVAVVDFVRARHASVAWLGHSMGGVVGALLPAARRDALAAVVTIGAPLFAGDPRLHKAFDTRRVVRAARFAHGRGFRFEGRRWSGLLYGMRRVLDVALVPAPMRIWAPGSLDDDALAFTLKQSFADDSWAVLADLLELVVTDGERAGRVDAGPRLRAFDRPILVVTGDKDDLAPTLGARPLHDRVSSGYRELREVDAGHIDLLIGDKAPGLVWEPISLFLRRHLDLPR